MTVVLLAAEGALAASLPSAAPLDLVVIDVDDPLSLEWAPQAVASGARVVDKSAAFRMEPDVPLVIAEVNPDKFGAYTPGTHIPIFPPERIAETRPDYILILPWNLKDEIMAQLAYVREWGAQFVVPIPRVRIYP